VGLSLRLRVVIPVLNEARGIVPCLAALQPLRARGAQIVVVDGGSTDATWALARGLADAVLAAPQGRAAQMNAGARWRDTGGQDFQDDDKAVLLFLHADTRLPPAADALTASALAAGRDWGRFDLHLDSRGSAAAARALLWLVAWSMSLRSAWTGIATGDQAIFVRRTLFDAVGGYVDQALMEDIALSARLKRHGPPARIRVPVLSSARRWLSQGVARTIVRMWQLRLAYFFGARPAVLALQYGYAARPKAAQAAVAVFARAPLAGSAKTRLAPMLGAHGAARAQRRFTLDTLHTAEQARLGPVTLWCAPDGDARFFRALRQRFAIRIQAQTSGDIGARMLAVFAEHFAQPAAQALLLMGTDCPVLAPGHLQAAARALETDDLVLIPVEDGGYCLIGMRKLVPEVFARIDWSTPRVMPQTRDRLRDAGVRWQELPPLWDVDEPPDWQRLQAMLTPTVASFAYAETAHG